MPTSPASESDEALVSFLGLGLPPQAVEMANRCTAGAARGYADELDGEARAFIEQFAPAMVVARLTVSPGEAATAGERVAELRRQVGDGAVLYLLADEGIDWPMAPMFESGADDIFCWPAESARFAARLERTVRFLGKQEEARRRAVALADKLERYEMAYHGTQDGLWDARVYWPDWFADENPIWFSPRFKALLGYEEDEFEDRLGAWKRVVYPDDQRRVFEALDSHLQHHTPFDIEYRVVNKRGELRWLRGLGLALWDRNGLPLRMAGSIRDITDQKMAEQQRDQFFQYSLDLFLYATLDGYFVQVNPAVTHTLGYTQGELLSRRFVDFVHPDDLAKTQHEIGRLREGLDTLQFENRYLCKDGSICWLSWRSPAPRPGESLVFAVARDITQRKLAEQALERERVLLKQMLEIQERDRRLISYEIHDGLVQQMTASLMHLEAFKDARETDPARAERNLARVLELMPQAVDEARRLISGLRPPVLDDLGVVAGVEYLIEQASGAIEKATFDADADLPPLPKLLEDTLFRVAQEALSNAVRHSGSPRVEVSLFREATQDAGSEVVLRVQDWGVGFDVEADNIPAGHFGVLGMRERCRLMDCALSIESQPGEGTTITARFPALKKGAGTQENHESHE